MVFPTNFGCNSVPRENGPESQKRASLNKLTQSGMWGDDTNRLSTTGLKRPTDSSSPIRRNHIIIIFSDLRESSDNQFSRPKTKKRSTEFSFFFLQTRSLRENRMSTPGLDCQRI